MMIGPAPMIRIEEMSVRLGKSVTARVRPLGRGALGRGEDLEGSFAERASYTPARGNERAEGRSLVTLLASKGALPLPC